MILQVSSRARVGSFQSDVVVSEFGHRLLRINLTDSLGTIHASYVGAGFFFRRNETK